VLSDPEYWLAVIPYKKTQNKKKINVQLYSVCVFCVSNVAMAVS